MPYRISMTVDIPDADVSPEGKPRATTRTAANAYDALSDMQEAAAKYNADFLEEDIEWYGFDPDHDELTLNSWTYADEEIVRDMLVAYETSLRKDDGEFDVQIWLDQNVGTPEEYDRVKREFEKRAGVRPFDANRRLLDLLKAADDQGCIVSKLAWLPMGLALVLLVGPQGSAQPYRVTTFGGGHEFNQGYYFAELGDAEIAWQDELQKRS